MFHAPAIHTPENMQEKHDTPDPYLRHSQQHYRMDPQRYKVV
jgi:hypothetical protein